MTQSQIDSKSTLSKLKIDFIKKNNLKTIFETLMVLPSNRTIADLNTLARILMTITPIKQLKDFSAIYCICKSMYLSKFKEKDFVYQKKDQAESLYIVLNGKIGLYRRSEDQFENDQTLFMNIGSCFGKIYKWKQKLVPLALQETLLAVLPQKEYCKIPLYLGIQKQMIVKQLKNAGIFPKVNFNYPTKANSSKQSPQFHLQKQKQSANILFQIMKNVSNTDIFQASQHCSLIRIPHGAYLIQESQTPKGLFYILKGMVKKVTQVKQTFEIQKKNENLSLSRALFKERNQSTNNFARSLFVHRYSAGDFFPQNNLSQPINFSYITECPSEIIVIPKKSLKKVGFVMKTVQQEKNKNDRYFVQTLNKQDSWKQYKDSLMSDILQQIAIKRQKKKKL